MATDKNGKTQLPKGISYRADKDLYMARFMFEGQQHTSYHKDLKSAEKWLADAKCEAQHGLRGAADKVSLNVWYRTWMDDFKRPNLKPTSIRTYEQIYDSYLKPALGGMHLAKIKPLHIQNLVNSLVDGKLSPKFIKGIIGVLYDMLEIACDNDLIVKNPAKTVTLPKPDDVERRVLTANEQNTLLTYAKQDKWRQYEPLLVTLLGTGMRIGECLALTWDDIDFENNVISINKTQTYIKGSKDEKCNFSYQTPKTKSGTRTIPLLSEVARALKRQKIAQTRLRLFMGPAWEPLCGFENLVLADETARIMERPVWIMDIGLRYLTDPSHVYPVLHLLERDWTSAGEMNNDALLYVHQEGHIEALTKEDLYLHRNDRLETNVLGTAVRIKNVTVAYLFAAELNRAFTDIELSIMRKLRELCALELRHSHDASRINQPAEARLLHELLDQQCRTANRVLSHGEALGIQFHSHMRMIILYQASGRSGMAPWVVVGAPFVQLFSQCLSTIYREQLVLLINQTEELSEYQWLRLNGLLEASGLKAAASRPFSQLAQTFSVYSDTLELMNCCESVLPDETCYRYEENIPLLAAHYLKDKIPLSDLANGALDKLRTYDEQLGQISFETVKQFVTCSFDIAKTAEVMHVHKNTMRYRISRAEEIINLNLSEGKVMFELMLAFAMDSLDD